jgi:hypothetical protein
MERVTPDEAAEFRKWIVKICNLSLEDLVQVEDRWRPVSAKWNQYLLDGIVEGDIVRPDIIIFGKQQ